MLVCFLGIGACLSQHIVLCNRTGSISAEAAPGLQLNIKIKKTFTFFIIEGVKDCYIEIELFGSINSDYQKIKKSNITFFGIDFGQYTGNAKIYFPYNTKYYISYAVFDRNCDIRKMVVMTENSIDLKSPQNKKMCVYNAVPGPYIIRSTFNISNRKDLFFYNNNNEEEYASKDSMHICNEQCIVVYQPQKQIENDEIILYDFDRSPLLYEGAMSREKYDVNYQIMSFNRTDMPDLRSKDSEFPYKKFFIVILTLIMVADFCIGLIKNENEEQTLLIDVESVESLNQEQSHI